MMRVEKGDRIMARWWIAEPVSLAGMQTKVGATEITVTGIARHFRGDHPTEPTEIVVYLDPEGPVNPMARRERPCGCMCPGHDDLIPVRREHVCWVETP